MAEKFEIYICRTCGNIVEVINGGEGELVCCGQSMELLKIQTEEIMKEKHKPVIFAEGENVKIQVGSILHPMTKEHYINFIEAVSLDGKYLYRKYLSPDEQPTMEFYCKTDKMMAREYCNIHGLFETINE